jgi:hypothetical protein
MPKQKPMTGPASLFRRKIREEPVSVTFTRKHHRMLKEAQERLGLSRSDVIALLVDQFAPVVRVPLDLDVDDE